MAVPGLDPLPPAHWPGGTSSKFSDKLTANSLSRKIVPCHARRGDETSFTNQGMASYFTDVNGLVSNEGKRALYSSPADVHEWRPSRRALSQPGGAVFDKPEGRRIVEVNQGQPAAIRERRHIRQTGSLEEYGDRPYGPKVVCRDNGLRAHDQPAREVDVASEMARKHRALDLCSQRNGVGCKALGDKNYRHPDYQSDFFKVGSLVVGSSFQRGHHSKTEARNATSLALVVSANRGPVRSYKETMREDRDRRARAEVEDLTRDWESSTLKEVMSAEDYAEYLHGGLDAEPDSP